MNLLDFDEQPTQTTNISTERNNTSGNLLEDIFAGDSQPLVQHLFNPVMMNTEQFGSQWVLNTLEKKGNYTSPLISSPQLFSKVVSTKLNLTPIEII